MAADLLGAMRVEIVGDNSKLDKSIDQSKKKTEDYGKTITTLSKSMKAAFTGVAIFAAVKGIAKLSSELISAASDAEETRNKFNVVFATVADDAQEAAERIKDEFKLSDETTEKFLSGVGDITSGLGATSSEALLAAEKITALGLDIDSFANLTGGASQAVSALTSLFTGEREAAKALGIVINDTNLKQFAEDSGLVFKELTPLEKGFLSLELATSQSQLAIGDFARSQESFANQSKIAGEAVKALKVEIGEALLPTATTIIGTFGRLTGALAEFIDERNRLEAAKIAVEVGTADIDQRIIALEAENEQLELSVKRRKNNLEAIQKQFQVSEDDLRLSKEQISLVEQQIETNQRIIDALVIRDKTQQVIAKQQLADAEATALALAQQAEAESLLNDRILARRSVIEVEIDLLNQQIEKWVQFREVAGVQELLNDLIEERTKLLEENTEVIDENITAIDKRTEAQVNGLLRAEEQHKTFTESAIEDNKELTESQELIAVGINSLTSGFEALGQSLVEEGLQFKDFGKLALTTLAEVLSALGAQLAAQAAINFFGLIPNVGGGIGSLAASATAFTASGVLKGVAASFQTGGIVPGTPSRIDNTIANVASGELIANQDQKDRMLMEFLNGGGSRGGNTTVIAQIDKKVLFKIILNGSKQGTAQFDSRGVINK